MSSRDLEANAVELSARSSPRQPVDPPPMRLQQSQRRSRLEDPDDIEAQRPQPDEAERKSPRAAGVAERSPRGDKDTIAEGKTNTPLSVSPRQSALRRGDSKLTQPNTRNEQSNLDDHSDPGDKRSQITPDDPSRLRRERLSRRHLGSTATDQPTGPSEDKPLSQLPADDKPTINNDDNNNGIAFDDKPSSEADNKPILSETPSKSLAQPSMFTEQTVTKPTGPIRTDPLKAMDTRRRRLDRVVENSIPEIHVIGEIRSGRNIAQELSEGAYCR
jgi:hypothetical protein